MVDVVETEVVLLLPGTKVVLVVLPPWAVDELDDEVVVLVEGRTEEVRWSEKEVRLAIEAGLARGERLKSLSTEIAKQAGWTSADVYRLGARRRP